ncbi:hypothetical protein M2480_003077 [Parabacteroides sp. PFB2-12]|nr:hypothetical protein [Parabacteroides sp. PM6-13]MDH6392069.1 hypothetical protein [Parabacteroides sp. PFB2-12]
MSQELVWLPIKCIWCYLHKQQKSDIKHSVTSHPTTHGVYMYFQSHFFKSSSVNMTFFTYI